jgi:hypothetical protein
MPRRCSVVVALALLSVAAAPAAGTSTGQAPLVPERVLEGLDLVQRDATSLPVPEDPTCRHLVAAQERAGSVTTSSAFQRWSSDDENTQFAQTTRAFASEGDARAFQRVYRAEDPTEECVELFLEPQDPTVAFDVHADDRQGVRLGDATVVAYLAEATFTIDDEEIGAKAEVLIAREGAVVTDTLFLAPEQGFPAGARRIERAVARLLARVGD